MLGVLVLKTMKVSFDVKCGSDVIEKRMRNAEVCDSNEIPLNQRHDETYSHHT